MKPIISIITLTLSTTFLFAQYSNRHSDSNYNYSISTRNLTYENLYLSVDGVGYVGKELPIGSDVELTFDQVEGYRLFRWRAFPQISMRVVEKKRGGNVVLQYDNLLERYEDEGLLERTAAVLTASLTIGKPLELGEKYVWEVEVTEGIGKGRITLKYDFEVVESVDLEDDYVEDIDTDFLYDSNGLEASSITLEIRGQTYSSYELPETEQVDMVFSDVEGFKIVNEKIYPGLSILVTDQRGKVILENPDLFAKYSLIGISPRRADRLISSLRIGKPMRIGENYNWQVRIWDKKWSMRTIDAQLVFTVVR